MKAKTNNVQQIAPSRGGIDIAEFLLYLDKVRRHGNDYMACCPAHEDKTPSLRVKQGEKGILVKCFAGCSYHEIVAALDLQPQDLFTDALTTGKKAEYRHRALLKEIGKLELTVWVYEQAMNGGGMTEENRENYREDIQTLINRRNEAEDLRREYGLI